MQEAPKHSSGAVVITEAAILAALDRKRKYTVMAQIHEQDYRRELEELDKGDEVAQLDMEIRHQVAYDSDKPIAEQLDLSIEDGRRALTQHVPVAELCMTGLHLMLSDDPEEENLGARILDKAKNALQSADEEPNVEKAVRSFTYITYVKMRVYQEKSEKAIPQPSSN